MDATAKIKLKADVGRIIDGEAWKAMEDGRASLKGSLWHLRQGWALEKAEQIIALVMSDSGTKRTLEHWRQEVGKLHSQIAAKDAELSRLREALEPFVKAFERRRDAYSKRHADCDLGYANFDKMPDEWAMEQIAFKMGAYRRARAALNESREGE